jgi:hypothetical protein
MKRRDFLGALAAAVGAVALRRKNPQQPEASRADELQRALDAARPGDVIVLRPGVTFTGRYTLRPQSGNGWITVQGGA